MSGMQAALLIRREKQRLRGGKVVNFRDLPSNLATRLIPPLPRYPPRSYVYGCGGGPGKAAWQGCSRPSPLPLSPMSPHACRGDGYKTKQCEAHRRWMKRNRIRDASYCYGSSGEDDEEDGSSNANRRRGEVSAAVNTVLYAGLGTTALGLVISFVGTGEKGFLSPELRLVGPSLLCAGLLCCLFRVLLCLCLCRCGQCRWRFCHVASLHFCHQLVNDSNNNRPCLQVVLHHHQQKHMSSCSLLPNYQSENVFRTFSTRIYTPINCRFLSNIEYFISI